MAWYIRSEDDHTLLFKGLTQDGNFTPIWVTDPAEAMAFLSLGDEEDYRTDPLIASLNAQPFEIA